MQVRKLLQDDDAVSPVIGVILMVAITVILAAVIAAFVLGLGGSDNVAPQTSFGYDYDAEDTGDDGALTITVQSGDSFTAGQVTFQGDGLGDNAGTTWGDRSTNDQVDDSSTIRSGARAILNDNTDPSDGSTTAGQTGLSDDFDLNIVWTSSDGDDSSIIGSRSGPDA